MGKGFRKEDSAALKGVAILIMVFIHSFRSDSRLAKYGIVFRGVTQDQIQSLIPFGKICVSLFAFVSGFGLLCAYKKRKQSPGGWVGSHLLKTLAGYWVIALASYGIAVGIQGRNLEQWGDTAAKKLAAIAVDVLGFSELMGTKSLNGTWWYMSAAACFIFLVPLLGEALERYGGIVCMGLVTALPRILGIECQGGNAVLTFLPAMVLGMLCCHYDTFEKFHELRFTGNAKTDGALKFTALALLILFGYWSFGKVSTAIFVEYKFALIPFAVILFCVEFLFKFKRLSSVLGFLGKHSMNIWLTHTFVRDWLSDISYGFREFWTVPLVILGISLGISCGINYLKKISGYDALIQKMLIKMK